MLKLSILPLTLPDVFVVVQLSNRVTSDQTHLLVRYLGYFLLFGPSTLSNK